MVKVRGGFIKFPHFSFGSIITYITYITVIQFKFQAKLFISVTQERYSHPKIDMLMSMKLYFHDVIYM